MQHFGFSALFSHESNGLFYTFLCKFESILEFIDSGEQ